ncbi:MAG: hypothetical protein HY606_08665 [Planctomycetes bacterium]|nr:hypothetical protein [Planctomycetota bacterium]
MQLIVLFLLFQSSNTDDWITESAVKKYKVIETIKKIEFTDNIKDLKSKTFVSIPLPQGKYTLNLGKHSEEITLDSSLIKIFKNYFILLEAKFASDSQNNLIATCGFKNISELECIPTINCITPYLALINYSGITDIKLSADSKSYKPECPVEIFSGNVRVAVVIKFSNLQDSISAVINTDENSITFPRGIVNFALKASIFPDNPKSGERIYVNITNVIENLTILKISKYNFEPQYFKITDQKNIQLSQLYKFRQDKTITLDGVSGIEPGKASFKISIE